MSIARSHGCESEPLLRIVIRRTRKDEVLHFVSPQRRVKLKGHSFREFVQNVVPLLDGTH